MKKIISLILCSILIVGCTKTNQQVTMKIKEETLTNTKAVVVIKDLRDRHYTYGEWFRIDYKKDDKWHKQKTITDDIMFNMIGYEVDDNNELELETDWEWLYGPLPPGEYRLVKRLESNTEIYAEFTIK